MTVVEKQLMPPMVVAQWKSLYRGKGARLRSRKFQERFMKQYSIKSTAYFYKIFNGKQPIDVGYIKFAQDLIQNLRSQYR